MTTTQTQTATIFANLYAAITAEKSKQFIEFQKELSDKKTVAEILSSWHYNELLPKGKKTKVWALPDLQSYLTERKFKQVDQALKSKLLHLQTVEKAPDLESITVSIEWKKSRMWGNNPNASARVCTKEYGDTFESGSIGGCGYDKESTAIAQAVNQSNSFLKALYLVKEKNPTVKNGDLFGYGSGYGILPRLEGGVGVNCYSRIFDKIGFKWGNSASGKTFDVYTATK